MRTVYGIVDENGNDADEYAYLTDAEAGIASEGYAKETGKIFSVKELGQIEGFT